MTAPRPFFDWLQLARASALPTALSNIMLGYLLATYQQAGAFQLSQLLSVLLVSACLYSAGMILNDLFDIEQDRIERPGRPIPSGRISIAKARLVGFGLLFLGCAVTTLISWRRCPTVNFEFLRPVFISCLLANMILAYDHWFKQTRWAPWLMGACRSLNLLLGASIAQPDYETQNSLGGFSPIVLAISCSLGLYVAGITFVGRKEAADKPSRVQLWTGSALIVLGILGFTFSNFWFSDAIQRNQKLAFAVPWLMVLLAFPVVRRSIAAALFGTKRAMQTAVVTGLRSIIVFDATLCFLAAPDRPDYALAVVSLLIPSILLSRWLNPT